MHTVTVYAPPAGPLAPQAAWAEAEVTLTTPVTSKRTLRLARTAASRSRALLVATDLLLLIGRDPRELIEATLNGLLDLHSVAAYTPITQVESARKARNLVMLLRADVMTLTSGKS